jgi:hypothetical protein
VLIALCLISGFAALAGMSSVLAVLVLGLGSLGVLAAAGFGALAMATGLWAAVIGLAPRGAGIARAA